MKLTPTITLLESATMMSSSNYQTRLLAEYVQLVHRINGLEEFLTKYRNNELPFEPTSDMSIYLSQMDAMRHYERALVARLIDEKIYCDYIVEESKEVANV